MSSDNPPARGEPPARFRPAPGQLQTNNTSNRNQRFSWQDTPLEIQRPTFQQFSSPTNSVIDESPISTPDGYQPFPTFHQPREATQYPFEKSPVERIGSPYNLPGPRGTHPAYFAPVAEELEQRQSGPQLPASPQPNLSSGAADPEKAREPVKSSPPAPIPNAYPQQQKDHRDAIKPDLDRPALIYNPSSLAGPNATIENHRPGQVAHPNATIEADWKHGLCEVDTLCCVGLCCPCIVYGKTQYRMSRKTQKEDATNLLGYRSCNGSCGLMGLACGFHCEYCHLECDLGVELTIMRGIFASIQRARVRKLYSIKGDFASDCLKSLCCCCCVIMQDEREVRDREDLIRRHAGPATTVYTNPPTMTYAPPPK